MYVKTLKVSIASRSDECDKPGAWIELVWPTNSAFTLAVAGILMIVATDGNQPALKTLPLRSDRAALGISMAVLGGLCFAIQDAGIKWLSAELAVLQIIFLRAIFGIVLLTASQPLTRETISVRVKRPGLLLLRTGLNILGWILFFSSLKYLPLATAVALFFSFPLFLAILSVPLLGETVGRRRMLAILVGFAGVVLITDPAGGISWPALVMLAAAFCWALVASLTRILGERENTSTILFYTLGGFIVLLAIPQVWLWQTPNLEHILQLFGVAFIGVIAQFSVIKAYAVATPSLVAPFEYTALIWSALLGYLLWNDVPTTEAVFGALLIIGSGLYIIQREARRARR